MIKNLSLLLSLLAIIGVWTFWGDQQSRPNVPTKEVQFENFEFTDIQGNTHTFYEYNNQSVIVHFWATWCTPCLEEFPDLIELAQKNQNNLTLLAIAVDDNNSKIKDFMKKKERSPPKNMIIGLDKDKTISKDLFGTVKLPESYVFTHSPHLKEKITGAYDSWLEYSIE